MTQEQQWFVPGQLYKRRDDVHGRFGGQQQSGIVTPAQHPFVFLFTGGGQHHGYDDGWTTDGLFRYFGEGRTGDMEWSNGNKAIRDHAQDGRDLHLFERVPVQEAPHKEKGWVRYLGQFGLASWEWAEAPDTEGTKRNALVFCLVAFEGMGTDTTLEAPVPTVAATLAELRAAAFAAAKTEPAQNGKEGKKRYYERSQAVRQYVLARAQGTCESCLLPAPFARKDGTPYLEPHHTRRLSDGGPDHPRWVAAICPTCHRHIHHGINGAQRNDELMQRLATIEPAV